MIVISRGKKGANHGQLIVIEGLDGSGKATQTQLLHNVLKNNYDITKLTFPDYTSESSALVKMYLNGEICEKSDEINAYAASSFFSVDRYVSFMSKWKRNYEQGNIILTDRYTTSNQIYQTAKLPKDAWNDFLNWSDDFEYSKLSLPKPDLVIYLDMSIEISQKLMYVRYNGNNDKKDIHEADIDFLYKCQEAAYYCKNILSWKVVNCCKNDNIRSIDDIHKDIADIVNKFLK